MATVSPMYATHFKDAAQFFKDDRRDLWEGSRRKAHVLHVTQLFPTKDAKQHEWVQTWMAKFGFMLGGVIPDMAMGEMGEG